MSLMYEQYNIYPPPCRHSYLRNKKEKSVNALERAFYLVVIVVVLIGTLNMCMYNHQLVENVYEAISLAVNRSLSGRKNN